LKIDLVHKSNYIKEIKKEKNANLVYEIAADVRFGHELANCEFWIMKLPDASVFVIP
jgi:hypothetical protein